MPVAVVLGASSNRSKFGNKAVRAFAHRQWTVIPVNPRESMIEGIPCVSDLDSVPRRPDVLSVYLPPQVVEGMSDAIARLAPAEVWLNPGTSNPRVNETLGRHGLELVHDCTLIRLGMSPGDFPDTSE
jgi:uncharacterized protein